MALETPAHPGSAPDAAPAHGDHGTVRLAAALFTASCTLLFATWLSLSAAPLAGLREAVLGAFGGAAYAAAAGLIAASVFAALGRGAADVNLRRALAAAVGLLAVWGIAGLIRPQIAFAGVDFAEASLGGGIGEALATPYGLPIAVFAIAAAVIAFPVHSRELAAAAIGVSGRWLSRSGDQLLDALGRTTPEMVETHRTLPPPPRATDTSFAPTAVTPIDTPAMMRSPGIDALPSSASGERAERFGGAPAPGEPRSEYELETVVIPDAARIRPRSFVPQSTQVEQATYVPAPASARRPPAERRASLLDPPAEEPQAVEPPQAAAPPPAAESGPAVESISPLVQEAPAAPQAPVTRAELEAAAPAPAPQPPPDPRQPARTLARTAEDGWRLPSIELLDEDPPDDEVRNGSEESARIIVETLASFGVDASVTQINEGPAITQFGIQPGWEIKTKTIPVKGPDGKQLRDEQGAPQTVEEEVSRTRVRVNRITRLADDLALALAAPSIRIEAPVPGQPIVGVEVPNADQRVVGLRGLIESDGFKKAAEKGGLPIALGRDVSGKPVIADLTKMPHVLIAGATGSGKSVCINTIITSLLMQQSPHQVRLILVDPKRVELTNYARVPHLGFSHVVTDPDEVVSVLGVVVGEMDRRYRKLEESGARNISAYNALPGTAKPMPYWVVVLDELADMMMAAPVDVEQQLVRLAQLARATGIHLVVATQRPSVDVVTGLIKANFPTRIAFATTSGTDARVIMDQTGAEKLLGKGDMLYMSRDALRPVRAQGAFVDDSEIERVIQAWSKQEPSSRPRPTMDATLRDLAQHSDHAEQELEAREAEAALRDLHATVQAAMQSEAEAEPQPAPVAEIEADGASDSEADDADDEPAVDFVDEGEELEGLADDAFEMAEEEEDDDPGFIDIVAEEGEIEEPEPEDGWRVIEGDGAAPDPQYDEAELLAGELERVSASLLQRRLRVPPQQAERLIERLERNGVIAPSDGGPSRRVLRRAEPVQG